MIRSICLFYTEFYLLTCGNPNKVDKPNIRFILADDPGFEDPGYNEQL